MGKKRRQRNHSEHGNSPGKSSKQRRLDELSWMQHVSEPNFISSNKFSVLDVQDTAVESEGGDQLPPSLQLGDICNSQSPHFPALQDKLSLQEESATSNQFLTVLGDYSITMGNTIVYICRQFNSVLSKLDLFHKDIQSPPLSPPPSCTAFGHSLQTSKKPTPVCRRGEPRTPCELGPSFAEKPTDVSDLAHAP